MAESRGGGDPLLLHLHKIPPSTTEEAVDHVLRALWETRKTGLGSAREPEVRSLLGLPSPHHLDAVLACLRLIIRRFVSDNLTGEDVHRLLPIDVSGDLRRVLFSALQRNQDQWKQEASRDQPLCQQSSRARHLINGNSTPAFSRFPSPEMLSTLWPRQHDATGLRLPNEASAAAHLHRDNGSSENLETIPRLKSMTWALEKRGLAPADQVAVVTLKLQDYTKSPSGEIEVKFQLSKDVLDSLLESMACISRQFPNTQVSNGEPSSKKQRQ